MNTAPRLPKAPLLMVISTPLLPPEQLIPALIAAAEGGTQLIQLRDKAASGQSLFVLAQALRRALPPETRLLINDRVDVAAAVSADGVHLPERGLPVATVRQLLSPRQIIGASVHSLDAAIAAAQEGADYLLVGTMFATASKPGKTPEGPVLLAQISAQVDCPLLGVGGIDPGCSQQMLAAGAQGCAVISYVLDHKHPKEQAKRMLRSMS